jgi:hypothetical protein
MRPLLSASLAAILFVSAAGTALAAADPCMRPAEKTAFDLAGLKSELMVTAITCQAEEKYNTFVVRFRPDLQGTERGLNTYFNRTAGRRAQQAHDDYITLLANSQSQDGLKQGTLFCNEHLSMFEDVMALKDARSLSSYASGKGLAQAIALVECPPPPAKKLKTAATK